MSESMRDDKCGISNEGSDQTGREPAKDKLAHRTEVPV